MNLIDWILNLAGLLLWSDWRTGRAATPPHAVISLANAARPAVTRGGGGWRSLAGLILLLLVRPLVYWTIGGALDWTPKTDLLAISIPWRSDLLDRIFLFSTLSFAGALGFYYACLLLAAAAHEKSREPEMVERFVRLQLGWLGHLPWFGKLLLPSVVAGLSWVALAPLLSHLGLLPPPQAGPLWGQALAIALASLLIWKWFLVALFAVDLLNTYVVLGNHPLWNYLGRLAARILRPIRFLDLGKARFSPVAGIVLVFLAADWVIHPYVLNLFQKFIA